MGSATALSIHSHLLQLTSYREVRDVIKLCTIFFKAKKVYMFSTWAVLSYSLTKVSMHVRAAVTGILRGLPEELSPSSSAPPHFNHKASSLQHRIFVALDLCKHQTYKHSHT